VFLVLTKDPTSVQGNTEKHYLSTFLATRSRLHVFAPLDGSIVDATNYSLPVKGITGAFVLNVLLAPYWVYQFTTERPDIVYCYQNVILPALLGKYVFGAVVVFDLRSDPYDQAQEFFDEDDRGLAFKLAMRAARSLHTVVLQRVDHVFVLSEPLADSVVENYDVDREQIHLLPLGVDTDRFRPTDESYDRFSIVYVGSLARYRGIDTFIDAVAGLSKEHQRQIRIDLYGSGPEEYVSELIADAAEDSEFDIHWHGLVAHEELPTRSARSDIAVSPIPPYEAFQVSSPAKLFEYLAMGLPVVASRIDPHERILNDGKTALLFDADSPADCRAKLARLVTDDELRTRLSVAARENSSQHSWEGRFQVVADALEL
jgi:glycosyltransferase involved in cell wall biosynthesis